MDLWCTSQSLRHFVRYKTACHSTLLSTDRPPQYTSGLLAGPRPCGEHRGTYLYWLKPEDRKKAEVCGADKGLVQVRRFGERCPKRRPSNTALRSTAVVFCEKRSEAVGFGSTTCDGVFPDPWLASASKCPMAPNLLAELPRSPVFKSR